MINPNRVRDNQVSSLMRRAWAFLLLKPTDSTARIACAHYTRCGFPSQGLTLFGLRDSAAILKEEIQPTVGRESNPGEE
jgi:hypothetical protein